MQLRVVFGDPPMKIWARVAKPRTHFGTASIDSRVDVVRAKVAPVYAALGFVVIAACGGDGPTGGGGRPSVAVIAGAGVTDTIGATLRQALVVQVRGTGGDVATGAVVRFTSVPPADTLRRYEAAVLTGRLDQAFYNTFSSDSADHDGRAKALVKLGTVAGTAKVVISVPEYGLEDTARFTVLPGNPGRVVLAVRDTTVIQGAAYNLGAHVVDRSGNARPSDIVTYEILPANGAPLFGVDASGRVTALSVGRGAVRARAGERTDTALASVVPSGTAVVNRNLPAGRTIATVSFDGSNFKPLATSPDQSLFPHWSPDGTRIAFYEGDPNSNASLSIVDMTGARRQLIAPPMNPSSSYPRFSADGWVYFTGLRAQWSGSAVFRIRPDGTGLVSVGTPPDGINPLRPSPSPDGSTVVFESNGVLGVQDVSSGAITMLGVAGRMPVFSPDGARIAYIGAANGLFVSDRNGANPQLVSSSLTFDEIAGVDWTSDGQWLLGRAGPLWRLINLNDGRQIPLTWSSQDIQMSAKR